MSDHELLHRIERKLDHLETGLKQVAAGVNIACDLIIKGFKAMSKELDDLTAQVKSNSDLLDSATTLINGIADRITAAGTDPAKLTALTNELKAKDDALATAVAANTPAAPAPPA